MLNVWKIILCSDRKKICLKFVTPKRFLLILKIDINNENKKLKHLFLLFACRIAWLVIEIAALIIFLVFVGIKIDHLAKHPKNVNLDVTYNKTLLFPAVTICNQNPIR